MMDRIEDETVRYLYFLQVNAGAGPQMPFAVDEEGLPLDDDGENGDGARAAAGEQQKLAAQTSMQDFTRNIQRKKERELEALQFIGGEAGSAPATVQSGAKVGRNDPCPCGSGKKYKKCHGAA
jgi:preprotein translocase subunit SecA